MATSKKTATKKSVSKKSTRTKKSSKKIGNEKLKKIISYSVFAIIVVSSLFTIGYYFGYESGSEDAVKHYEKKLSKKENEIKSLQQINRSTKSSMYDMKSELQKVLKKHDVTAAHEYATKKPPKAIDREERQEKNSKPKLAIIIDDVSFKSDVRNIKAVGINLTMSFLPPTKRHPDSAILANKEPYYMVHLPMEAMNFHSPEPLTLMVNDSKSKIDERIKKIKKLFPKVQYINNHTGSKFTSSRIAMMRLVDVLDHEHIGFIDSRTIASTKAPEVMRYYHKPYIARDVFLDHDGSVEAVKKQIRVAIEKAKKYGKVIAIGHPHKNTLQALKESKDLFKDVQLVRIDHY